MGAACQTWCMHYSMELIFPTPCVGTNLNTMSFFNVFRSRATSPRSGVCWEKHRKRITSPRSGVCWVETRNRITRGVCWVEHSNLVPRLFPLATSNLVFLMFFVHGRPSRTAVSAGLITWCSAGPLRSNGHCIGGKYESSEESNRTLSREETSLSSKTKRTSETKTNS